MKQDDKPHRRKVERSDNIIPDYDYLFDESSNRKGKKSKTKFFSKIVKLNIKPLIASTLIFILMNSPTWIIPVVTANIINIITGAVASPTGITPEAWQMLWLNIIIWLVLIIQNVPTTIWRWRVTGRMLRRTDAGVKSAVVRKLQSLSITYHKDVQSGKIHAKFLKDTESVQGLFSSIVHSLIPCILTLIIAIAISVSTNVWISLCFLVIIPIDVILVRLFNKRIWKAYHEYRVQNEEMGARMSTMLEMVPVTKAHGLEQEEISLFKKAIKGLAKAGFNIDKNTGSFGAMSWVIHAFMNCVCLVICALFALNGQIGVGDIVLYQSMFAQISSAVSSLVNIIPTFASGKEALDSISEIMSVTDVETSIGKLDIPAIEGNVKFENVSYKYPDTDQYVINGLDLDVKAGECIAVVGASGSGKSTLMNMIIGFLKPIEGRLLVDGKEIDHMNLSQYRHNISVVPQNSILFSGTIRENITYGLPCYKEEDLQRVVEMANLNEFIKDLPNGIDTVIGEHGDKLSGGQKQRITIARALIRNPKILILDEATSALDNISEYHVQKAISSSIRGRTTFIVAHRLSTIRDADRIIVLEDGVAVEMGTFEQLMERKGKFYELKQLSEINMKKAERELA